MINETAGQILESQKWIFAKTMPKNPHWYTLKENWESVELFNAVVQYIRDNSYTEYFWGKPYQMFNFGNYKYWTMGNPISMTKLINRAKT